MFANSQRIVILLESKEFKRVFFIFGIIFLVLSVFISVNPKPFLKFGYFGVFIFNLFGPGTLLIPTLAMHMNVLILALFSALGMVLNDSVSWLIGNAGQPLYFFGH